MTHISYARRPIMEGQELTEGELQELRSILEKAFIDRDMRKSHAAAQWDAQCALETIAKDYVIIKRKDPA